MGARSVVEGARGWGEREGNECDRGVVIREGKMLAVRPGWEFSVEFPCFTDDVRSVNAVYLREAGWSAFCAAASATPPAIR